MALRRSKKGFIFTILTVTLLVVILVLVTGQNAADSQENRRTIAADSASFKTIATSITDGDFLEVGTQASAYSTLVYLSSYLNATGVRFADEAAFLEAFEEVFLYGTIGGVVPPMAYENHTSITTFLNNISVLVDESVNGNLQYEVVDKSVFITHDTPWTLNVSASLIMSLSDNVISYNDSYVILATQIDIYDLVDPFIVSNTTALAPAYERRIERYSSEPSEWDLFSFQGFYQDSLLDNKDYYVYSPLGPSFLQRFTNNLSANPLYGIDTFIDAVAMTEFFALGIGTVANPVTDRAYVAIPYLGETKNCELVPPDSTYHLYNTTALPLDFLLDWPRVNFYWNITDPGDSEIDRVCPT